MAAIINSETINESVAVEVENVEQLIEDNLSSMKNIDEKLDGEGSPETDV